jgi:phage-related protein
VDVITNPYEKPVEWVASSKKDLLEFPEEVIQNIGYGLSFVQLDFTPDNASLYMA